MNAMEAIIESFTPEEKIEASELEAEIDQISKEIHKGKSLLEANFVKIGGLFHKFERKKYWLLSPNCRTAADYMEKASKKIGLSTSQIYQYISVNKNLLPHLTEANLQEMGITKAGVLSSHVKKTGGNGVPEDLLTKALDPKTTTSDLKGEVAALRREVSPDEKGKWLDIGGFFVTTEERKEITDCMDLAKGIDPVIPHNVPEWQQVKEIVLRWTREFANTWGGR